MMIAWWSFEPRIPITLWWSLFAVCIVALVSYWIRRDHSLGTWQRSLLTVLLGLSIVGPLLIALNPTWLEEIPPAPGKPLVMVYLDQTMSMDITDVDDRPAQTRHQSALWAAQQIGESTETVDVRKSAFDSDIHPLEIVDSKDTTKEPLSTPSQRGTCPSGFGKLNTDAKPTMHIRGDARDP